MQSPFNRKSQQEDVTSKIVVGLEKISEAFRSMIWEYAKMKNLSPIQIQILIFLKNHEAALCNVSHLAKEFNLTKPTISDAIKVFTEKKSHRKAEFS